MAAVDAQFYWMSAKVPNDQFLLYAFAGEPKDLEGAIDEVCNRARGCPDLAMRVEDGGALSYPRWVAAAVESTQVVRHEPAEQSWRGCLDAVAALADSQLDIRQMPWRLHIFTAIRGIPGCAGGGVVAVLQVAHALADGTRASALAAWLFGREVWVPRVDVPSPGCLLRRAADAARTHHRLVCDTRAGLLSPAASPRPPVATNVRPDGARTLRTVVRKRTEMPGATVTVGALAAVSTALFELLDGSADALGAEVPIAKPGVRQAHNHFGNVVVGLYPQLAVDARMERIAADLAHGRRRFQHPAAFSADRAFAAVPAPLLRWGVAHFDPTVRPVLVAGNTVLSSVYRGAGDLHFGGAPVVLTAGYPALSPSMGLTHGVHGIGDTIAISVHAAASAVADVDAYVRCLDSVL
ncbi:WS/DGAT domain-containing protein [Mycobacterium basiliense]|nr:WS/DGAT domain-containing protein [Mycobacterium basiliense]